MIGLIIRPRIRDIRMFCLSFCHNTGKGDFPKMTRAEFAEKFPWAYQTERSNQKNFRKSYDDEEMCKKFLEIKDEIPGVWEENVCLDTMLHHAEGEEDWMRYYVGPELLTPPPRDDMFSSENTKTPKSAESCRNYAKKNLMVRPWVSPHYLHQFLRSSYLEDIFYFCSEELSDATYAYLSGDRSEKEMLSWWRNPAVTLDEQYIGLAIWPEVRHFLNTVPSTEWEFGDPLNVESIEEVSYASWRDSLVEPELPVRRENPHTCANPAVRKSIKVYHKAFLNFSL